MESKPHAFFKIDKKSIIQLLGGLAVIFTIFPFVAIDYWWIRVFDFPHVQLTIFTLIILLTFFLVFDFRWLKDYLFFGILLTCFIVQLLKIFPYTPLAPFEVENASDKKESLTIFISNVLQKNNQFEKLRNAIKSEDPDVVLLTETNETWLSQIKSVTGSYRYKVEVPLGNTYGMALYSKKRLLEPKVNYLLDKEIPSIQTKLLLNNRDTIQLYTIHPRPPAPGHSKTSNKRDAEMMIIAKKVNANPNRPHLVFGDFNDVAWSRSTKLFQEVSGLLDIRKGRGFYSTFNAKNFLMRWPLDHIFTSKEFRAINLKRYPSIESDHFPIVIELSFEPQQSKEQQKEKPSSKEMKKADKEIKDGQEEKDKS